MFELQPSSGSTFAPSFPHFGANSYARSSRLEVHGTPQNRTVLDSIHFVATPSRTLTVIDRQPPIANVAVERIVRPVENFGVIGREGLPGEIAVGAKPADIPAGVPT